MTQKTKQPIKPQRKCLGLVFTSEGVRFGVVIRSTERYNVIKVKPTESKVDYRCHLRLRRSSEIQNCWSSKYSKYSTGIVVGCSFHFYLRFHLTISDKVMSRIGRKLNRSDSSNPNSIKLGHFDSSLVKTSLIGHSKCGIMTALSLIARSLIGRDPASITKVSENGVPLLTLESFSF